MYLAAILPFFDTSTTILKMAECITCVKSMASEITKIRKTLLFSENPGFSVRFSVLCKNQESISRTFVLRRCLTKKMYLPRKLLQENIWDFLRKAQCCCKENKVLQKNQVFSVRETELFSKPGFLTKKPRFSEKPGFSYRKSGFF